MKEINIRRYVQPFIYGLPLSVGLSLATIPLFTDLYNPPTNFQRGYWCLATTYPFGCDDEFSCIRGGKHVRTLEKRAKALQYVALISVLIMVGSLLLVIGRVIRTGCLLRRQGIAERKQQNAINDLFERFEMENNDDDQEIDDDDDSRGSNRALSRAGMGQIPASANLQFRKRSLLRSSAFERISRIQLDTKVVILQAVLYIMAFFSGLAWTFNDRIDVQAFKFGLIFVPSQGLFNLIIFLWHKIYNYKRQHPDTPTCQVISLLFTTPVQEAFFVSRISLVLDDNFDAEGGVCDNDMPMRIPQFQIDDEMGEEEIMNIIKRCDFNVTKVNSYDMERCGISEGSDMMEDFLVDSSDAGNVKDHDYGNANSNTNRDQRIYRRGGTLNTSHTSNTTGGTRLTRSTTNGTNGISDGTLDTKFFPVSLRASDFSMNGSPGQDPDPEPGTDLSREVHSLHSLAGSGIENINGEYTSSSDDTFLRTRLALLQEEEETTEMMQDVNTACSCCEDLSIDGLSGFSDAGLPADLSLSTEIEEDN